MKEIKGSNRHPDSLRIEEEFIPIDTRTLDSKNRITLGGKLYGLLVNKMKVDSYKIFIGKKGDILLRPSVSIPSKEAWVYKNPEVIGKIRKGIGEAREGKTEKINDLEKFLGNL